MTGAPQDTQIPSNLWHRDFALFFAARTISVFGDHMLIPVTISVAMLQAGYGVTGVGYALAAQVGPFALFVIFGGVLVDRFTPLRIMVISDLARVAIHGALAFAFATGTPDMWLILALLAASGVGTGAFQPGLASVIPRIARDVQRANAAIRITESMMIVAGPAAAGLLIAFSSVWVVLVIDAATFGVSAICLLAIRLRIPRSTASGSMREDLVEGWREFRSRNWLWGVIAIWMLFQVTASGPHVTLGQSLITLAHGETALGFIMAVFGLGSVLGGLLAVRIKPHHPLRGGAIALSGVLFGPLVVAMELCAPLIAAGYLVTGIGMAFWLVMFHTSVQTHVPPEVLGRVHAYDVAGSLVMKPVGQGLAGPISLIVGAIPYLFFSTAMTVVIVALLLAVPAIRNLTRASR